MLKFWIVKDYRGPEGRVKIGAIYTTVQLMAKGLNWTDNYGVYDHFQSMAIYAKPLN